MAKVEIDDDLLERALKLGKHKNIKEAVSEALVEYVRRIEQLEILSLFGKIDYDYHKKSKSFKREPH